jgi:hypothetical protein
MKCSDAEVNLNLLSKAIISVMGDKHHRHPVITGVTRNLFRATATHSIHTSFISCRVVIGQANACRTRQESNVVCWRKKRFDFSSADLSLRFRSRSIPSRNYKKE